MLEIIKEILESFIYFDLIEAYIFCLFFTNVCECRKFKFYEIILLGFINCIVCIICPIPIIKQIIGGFYIIPLISNLGKHKIKYSLKLYILLNMILVSLEMTITIILTFFELYAYNMSGFELFLMTIPARIIEIILFKNRKGEILMKWFMGTGVKRR